MDTYCNPETDVDLQTTLYHVVNHYYSMCNTVVVYQCQKRLSIEIKECGLTCIQLAIIEISNCD